MFPGREFKGHKNIKLEQLMKNINQFASDKDKIHPKILNLKHKIEDFKDQIREKFDYEMIKFADDVI